MSLVTLDVELSNFNGTILDIVNLQLPDLKQS